MPYALTHILVAIILIELFREYFAKNNKRFPRYYVLIAAFGSILPDLDFAFFYILSPFGFTLNQIHRTFLHTLFVPLILLLAGILFWKLGINNKKLAIRHMKLFYTLFILSAASLLHLILDAIFVGSVTIFYPFPSYSIGLNLVNNLPSQIQGIFLPTIDAILIIIWLFWLEFKLKIRDYI